MKFGLEEELIMVNYENINNSNLDGMSLASFCKVGQQFQNFCIPGCLLIDLNIVIQNRHQSLTIFQITPPHFY